MRSRRDQVQAHAYVVGRLTSALVHAEPDAPESPLRRTGLGSFGGLLVGALIVAAFLVWGLISPASRASALTSGELVMVRETGSRFIYAGKALHPVLNWSSALLLMGGNPTITTVSAQSVAGVPQGQPLGILGAPDALPAPAAVNTGAWLACARGGAGQPSVSLSIGGRATVIQPSAGNAFVVDATGTRYLIWHGHRLRVDAPWIPTALGLGRGPVTSVSPVWLNAVPAGPDLEPISVPGAGGAGPALGHLHPLVGQILAARNVGSSRQFYLVEPGGLAPVTATQAALLLAGPSAGAAYQGAAVAPVPVSPAAAARAAQVHASLPDSSGVPPAPPAVFAPGGGAVPCTLYPGAGAATPGVVFAVPPPGRPPVLTTPGVTASPEGADLISVAPGDGALVRPQAAPGVAGNSLFLVTDTGVKYPVPTADVAALGYRSGAAASLPAALLGLLPTGPALDLPPLRG